MKSGTLGRFAQQEIDSLDPAASQTATIVSLCLREVAPSQRLQEKQACKVYQHATESL
jgi:hypothetical protein